MSNMILYASYGLGRAMRHQKIRGRHFEKMHRLVAVGCAARAYKLRATATPMSTDSGLTAPRRGSKGVA